MHLHGQHKVDPPGLPGTVDALFKEGVLRIVQSPFLFHAHLLA